MAELRSKFGYLPSKLLAEIRKLAVDYAACAVMDGSVAEEAVNYEQIVPEKEDWKKYALYLIKDRYFRSVIADKEGKLVHHGDCNIYKPAEIYGFSACDCGLIHDLGDLGYELSQMIFPKYGEQWAQSEICWEPDPENPGRYKEPVREPISWDQVKKLFQEAGIVCKEVEEPEIDREPLWKLVEEVFGEVATQKMRNDFRETVLSVVKG